MSKYKNKFQPSGIHQPEMQGEKPLPPDEWEPQGISLSEVREANSKVPLPYEPGEYRIVIGVRGELVSVEPITRTATDIVIHCPRKSKKCVATFEVQRLVTGKVEMCCNECVGPANQNTYQKML